MSRQIELNLTSLLPTLNLLPPELIHLASSLLGQSRAKVPSLKPEEEIGRTYACCHIACQRLGSRLGLELAKPSPPVKPKVYQKLHAYLNSTLKTTSAPNTPRTRRTAEKDVAPPSSVRTRGSIDATPTPARTAGMPSTLGKRTGGVSGKATVAPLPRYTMNMIKHLCKARGTPDVAPHVFAGVETIYHQAAAELQIGQETPDTPSKRRRTLTEVKDSEAIASCLLSEDSLPALVITVYGCAADRMYNLDHEEVEDEQRAEDLAIAAIIDFFEGQNGKPPRLKGTKDLQNDIKDFMHEALEWVKMEWYTNIPDGGAAGSITHDTSKNLDELNEELGPLTLKKPAKTPLRRKEKHASRPDEEHLGAAGLLPGLGTMFQPAVDWLSEDRRAENARWEKGIRKRIAAAS